jgi:hypothetical protein
VDRRDFLKASAAALGLAVSPLAYTKASEMSALEVVGLVPGSQVTLILNHELYDSVLVEGASHSFQLPAYAMDSYDMVLRVDHLEYVPLSVYPTGSRVEVVQITDLNYEWFE